MANIINKSLKYIYIVFSIFLLLFVTLYFRFSIMKLGIILILMFGIAISLKKYKHNIIIGKRLFLFLLGISIIIRFLLLLVPYGNVAGDTYFFYLNASDYALGNGINNSYISLQAIYLFEYDLSIRLKYN